MISLFESASAPKPNALISCTQKTFEASGILEQSLKLEHREQQASMANAVAKAFAKDHALLFEAGTGVGKSLAYLIPGIIQAVKEQRPLVVSTHTKALQEQVLHKDLKLCAKLFNKEEIYEPYRDFKTVLLVGRGNYLCTNRLAQAQQRQGELFPSQDQEDLRRITQWAAETETGLLEEISPQPAYSVWEWVNADASTCNRKNCSPDTCFYQRIRAQIKDAHVLILNHSLLFSLMYVSSPPAKGVPGVLFPEDFLVLDEAHTVPHIATEHFGLRISQGGIEKCLKMLYNPRRKKGMLTHSGHKYDAELIIDALMASDAFFAGIYDKYLSDKKVVRLHQEDWAELTLLPHLQKIAERLGTIASQSNSEKLTDEYNDQRSRVLKYAQGLQKAIALEPEDHVHWLEASGRLKTQVTIRSAPIDVAPYLKDNLFNRNTSVVMTSATLAISEKMDKFANKVGAENSTNIVEYSPFDYENNMQIAIATDAPAPSKDGARLCAEYLSDNILYLSQNIEGGTLVLFTSYFDMYRVGELLEDKLDRPLFMQGKGGSRTELAQSFAKEKNAVLLGADSFWTGIDVPGPALSQVIIARLPFQNPSHPIREAQNEYVEDQGKSPFMEITLPEAITQFRQGIGRLIRKKTDTGRIIILDSRIIQRPYGRLFSASMPHQKYIKFNRFSRELVFKK